MKKKKKNGGSGSGDGGESGGDDVYSSSSQHRYDNTRMGSEAMLQLSHMRPNFFTGPGSKENPYEPWQYDPQPQQRRPHG